MKLILFFGMTVAVVGAFRTEPAVRQLQSAPTLNYRASYRADFQHYSDSLCGGDPPVLLVACKGPSSVMTVNTSNATIVCLPQEGLTLFPNVSSTVYQCENTCVESDCDKLYRYEADIYNPIAGPFGSIFFSCEGDTVDSIDAVFVFLGGSTEGYCGGTSTRRNYHIGRLGVSCPKEDGSSLREYVYDDTFVECRSRDSFVLDLNPINEPDIYACVAGEICNSQCFFNFTDFWMEADVPQFYETCVESLVEKTQYPTKSPISFPVEFTAQFEASWATVYDPMNSISSCAASSDDALVVAISCDMGGNISFVSSNGIDANSCTQTTPNELLCSTNENVTMNNLVSVFYECVGQGVPPATTVTFRESPVFCDSSAGSVDVRHVVTLGAFCESLQAYFSGDLLFECTERDYNFEVVNNQFGKQGERFACFESVTLPIGSTQNVTVPTVAVTTDSYWIDGGDSSCYTKVRQGPSPVTSPTPPGTSQPVTSMPVMAPAEFPIPSPSTTATNAPMGSLDPPSSLPIPKPAIAPTTVPAAPVNETPSLPVEPPSPGGDGPASFAGPVIGGVAAGIAMMAVIGFFVLRKKRTNGKPKGEVPDILSKTFSAKGSSRFLQDDALQTESTGEIEPSQTSLPTPVLASTSLVRPVPVPSYNVTYKDQSRSVIEPVLPALAVHSQEDIPFAVAVNTSAPSDNAQWAQAEPMAPPKEGLFDV